MSNLVSPRFQRAIRVILSDTIPIPAPMNLKLTGTNSIVLANSLLVTGIGNWAEYINVGDIVVNTSNFTIATVTSVNPSVSAVSVGLSANLFTSTGTPFAIYSSRDNIYGMTLYNGTAAATIVVITAGGERVQFVNVPIGFLPVKVSQVLSTGSTANTTLVALY
jgi:hypothetical protein